MKKLLEIKNIETNEWVNIRVNKYSVDYSKNWGSQQRNLVGAIRGRFIGFSADVSALTDYLSQKEMEAISGLLNQATLEVRFFDSASGETREGLYIASDVTSEMFRINKIQYTALGFKLTAINLWVS